MKKQIIVILFLLTLPLFSQTKMIIYKTDGSVDSVILSQIKDITFTNTSSPVSTQGLVAYYPFDGNAVDSSGHGYNGTVYFASYTKDRFGVDTGAYSFDGQGDAIDLGNILDQVFCAPVAKFSVSGWALVRSGNGPISSHIIGKNAGGNGPYQWVVSYLNGYIVGSVFSDSAGQNYIALINPVSFNQWVHFVLVFDGSLPELQRVKLYVNGTTNSTSLYQHSGTLGTSTTDSQQRLSIGASRPPNTIAWNNFLNGDVDDIRIYNRALSDSEVLSLYLSTN